MTVYNLSASRWLFYIVWEMMKKTALKAVVKVAAAIIERDGEVFIARRRDGGRGGCWEFPGGKVEGGETPEAALEREIREELGVRVRVGEMLHTVTYRSRVLSIDLIAYRAELVSGEFKLTDHDEIRWVRPSALVVPEFSEPDRPIARRLTTAASERP